MTAKPSVDYGLVRHSNNKDILPERLSLMLEVLGLISSGLHCTKGLEVFK